MNGFKMGERIGSGGFCQVHKVTQLVEGKVVGPDMAMKRLLPEHLGDDVVRHRFEREARLMDDTLDHPNIVPIIHRNVSGDEPYFLMPLADGNLWQLVESRDVDEDWICSVYRQILEAMSYAHGKSVIHRDLKPKNALVFGDEIRISDFGLGKALDGGTIGLTRTSVWTGSEPYMPPEQYDSMNTLGPEADVFALGKLLMALLTGEQPETGVPDTSELPPRFQYFIQRCCEKKPENRFGTAGEALAAFDRIVADPTFIEKPADALTRLTEKWFATERGPDVDVVREIDELLRTNPDEEVLFSREVPRLPEDILDQYQDDLSDSFVEMIKIYDGHVSGGLTFEYCDVVSDFYVRVFHRSNRLDLKQLVLARLISIAYSHNRFYVMDAVRDLLSGMSDASTVAMASDVIEDLPRESSGFLADSVGRYPKAINDAIARVSE